MAVLGSYFFKQHKPETLATTMTPTTDNLQLYDETVQHPMKLQRYMTQQL
jgi:hypothetical protein